MTQLAITFDDVAAARERLRGVTHHTPVLRSRSFDERCGAEMFFKPENLQRVGAFKLRGAYNAIAQFTPEQRRGGVLTFSSGNHAQAIALAAQMLGVKATVLMPQDAPQAKIAATRGYGAEVRHFDRYREDGEQLVRALAEAEGMTVIPPFDHPHVTAGQGTLALELLEDTGPLDLLVTPVGGGGLLSGCATAARHLQPACRLFGVEPEAGNDAQQSLAAGRSVGRHTFPVLQQKVEGIVTVSDDELVATMKFLAERMKLVVEPTGCLAAAAVLHGKLDVKGLRVGVVLSGGNIDLQRLGQLFAG
jgi:threonine dehydratase